MNTTLTFYRADIFANVLIPYAKIKDQNKDDILVQEHIELSIDLNKELIKHPVHTFFARVSGDTMRNENIQEGDILVIDKSSETKHEKLAVCCINGSFTVKRIHIENNTIWLMPVTLYQEPIKVTSENEFLIWGIVTHIIKKTHIKQ